MTFYYYGRKARLAPKFPEPYFDTIVEPFCGSAAYSLHGDRWKNAVVLNDLDPYVVAAWRWLIHDATEADIDALPTMRRGDRLSAHTQLSEGERAFLMFIINPSAAQVSDVTSRNGADRFDVAIRRAKSDLHKVKHWEITSQEYHTIEDRVATWFIDPPYQTTGHEYMTNTVDFDQLREWCLSRTGQRIICENADADWIDGFIPLASLVSGGHNKMGPSRAKKRSEEVVRHDLSAWAHSGSQGTPS